MKKHTIKYQWYRAIHLTQRWAQMSAEDVRLMDETYQKWEHVKTERGPQTANEQLLFGFELDEHDAPTQGDVIGPLFCWRS